MKAQQEKQIQIIKFQENITQKVKSLRILDKPMDEFRLVLTQTEINP